MSYVRIVSKRKGGVQPQDGELVIPVDRSNPVLGNPHRLEVDSPIARIECIRKYEVTLEEDWAKEGPMFKATQGIAGQLLAGQPIALQCWCAPKPCHAEVLRGKLEELLGRNLTPPAGPAWEQGVLF